MERIYRIFKNINSDKIVNKNGFSVAALPNVRNHKIGVSANGQPLYFIKCSEEIKAKFIDVNLEYVSVQYNRKCQLISKNKQSSEGNYTVLSLKSDVPELQEYFIDIVYIVVKKLPEEPNLSTLKKEVEKLINLFSKLSKPALKTVQGLWSELLVILKSKNPNYLVNAWHKAPNDKYDFNDGVNKIEIKSTSRSKRIHTFSLEQLSPNKNSDLIVVSLFVIETGIGKTIFDLVDSIEKRIKDSELLLRLNEVIVQTLGSDLEKAFEMKFDFQLGVDSIRFYSWQDIPSISSKNIEKEVTNIHFDSDLTNVKPTTKLNSTLHKSLNIFDRS